MPVPSVEPIRRSVIGVFLKGLMAGLIYSVSVQAGTPDSFDIHGFGTLGLSRTNTDKALYRADSRNPGGAGESWDASLDSKLGVQGDLNFNDSFGLTAQVVAAKQADNRYGAEFEWLYLSYWISADLAIRAGRTHPPIFMVSDYLDVGNAYTWVRPPIDVYKQSLISSMDGLDAVYEYRFDNFSLLLQPFAGRSQLDLFFTPTQSRLKGKVDHLYGLNVSLQWRKLSFSMAHTTGRQSFTDGASEMQDISDQLIAFSSEYGFPSALQLASKIAGDNKAIAFSSVGVNYDDVHAMVLAEYTQRRTDSIFPSSTAWYVSGGIHIGALTPYLSYSESKIDSPTHVDIDDPEPPSHNEGHEPYEALEMKVNALLANMIEDRTMALGLRFDFSRRLTLKAQYETIYGGLLTAKGRATGDVMVMSVVLDFVF